MCIDRIYVCMVVHTCSYTCVCVWGGGEYVFAWVYMCGIYMCLWKRGCAHALVYGGRGVC